MAFRVEIQPQAFEDLDTIAAYIKARSSFETAQRWFTGIILDIATLKEMPTRCSVAPESEELDREVHLLLHGHEGTKAYGNTFELVHRREAAARSYPFAHIDDLRIIGLRD